jgi:GT2 family glycosyltransferase
VSSEVGAPPQSSLLRIGERVALIDGAAGLPAVLEAEAERILDLPAGDRRFTAALLRSPLDDETTSHFLFCESFEEFFALNHLEGRDRSGLLSSIFGLAAPMLRLDQDGFLKALLDELLKRGDLRKATLAVDVFGDQELAVVTLPKRLDAEEGAVFVAMTDGLDILRLGPVERRLSAPQSDKRLATLLRRSVFADGRYLLMGSDELIDATIKIETHADFSAQTGAWPAADLDKLVILQAADEAVAADIDIWRKAAQAGKGVARDWSASLAFTLDACLSMPHGMLAAGWFFDPEDQIEDVTAIDYSLEDPALSDRWVLASATEEVFGAMRDVRRFSVFASRKQDVPAAQAVTLRLGLKNGGAMFVHAPVFARDLTAQRAAALASLSQQSRNLLLHFEHAYHPALSALQRRLIDRQEVEALLQFGKRSSRQVSLIIPLYRDLSFIRSQLMAFARDRDLAACAEIIFVVDDPALAETVETMIEGAAFVYDLDLRVAILRRNGGYAQANNIAASIAEGETLVLMNSDVAPEKPGWLPLLKQRLEALPAYSAVGPKLLYADGSIQHVGMGFKRFSDGLWRNFHDWKGFARHFPPADVEREVAALTGACLVIRKRDFLSVGGFSTDYIGGDFEDSDLCLSLRAKGGVMLCAPQAELFHFERQSIGKESAGERPESVYNRLLHTHRWNHVLDKQGGEA